MDGRQSREGGSRVPWLWSTPVIKKEGGRGDRSQRFPESGAVYLPSSEGVRRQLLIM